MGEKGHGILDNTLGDWVSDGTFCKKGIHEEKKFKGETNKLEFEVLLGSPSIDAYTEGVSFMGLEHRRGVLG